MSATVEKRKSRGWIWLIGAGLVAITIGIITGFTKAGDMCGSVFKPDSFSAEIFDTLQGSPGGAADECKSSIAAAAVPTWILIVLGVILILTAVIVRAIGKSSPSVITAAPVPTVATQIEDLSRLKSQGLISDEEFESKRAELLERL